MKKKILLVVFVLFVVLTLSGCSASAKTMASPISSKGGGFFIFILVRPIGWMLNAFSFGNFYALGILFTTLLIRTVAWPVYAKTNDMSLKMQLAQPELARIQTKYATRQDPVSKQKQTREMMALFKKYRINPLGCIIAPLIQFPLFMAMYQAVQRFPNALGVQTDAAGEIVKRGATGTSVYPKVFSGDLNTNFFGIDLSKGIKNIKDLSVASNWIYVILPILVGVTMFFCQWIAQRKPSYAKKTYPNQVNTQNMQTEKIMKIMMYVMTGMMVLMSFQSGTLCFYWIVGNLYTIVQTLINRKTNEIKYLKARESSNIIG